MSVALKIGVVPTIGLPNASAKEIVINETDTPSALTGVVPTISELATEGAPAVNVTVPPAFIIGVAIERVLTSAFVDFRVQVDSPDALGAEQAPFTFIDPVFVAEKVGVIAVTALLFASLKVIITVEVAIPSATTGPVPVINELAATAEPAEKITVPSTFTTGVTILRVFVSAFVDLRVQVEIPEAFELEQDP